MLIFMPITALYFDKHTICPNQNLIRIGFVEEAETKRSFNEANISINSRLVFKN